MGYIIENIGEKINETFQADKIVSNKLHNNLHMNKDFLLLWQKD